METKILSALIKSREAYDRVADHVDLDSFSPAGATLIKFIKQYYDADPDADHCDVDVLRGIVETNTASGAMQDQLQDTLTYLDEDDSSVANVVQNVLDQRRKTLGMELAQSILTGRSASEVQQHLEEYSALVDKVSLDVAVDEEYISPNLEELITDNYSEDNLIAIAPRILNDRLGGGLTKKRHIVLAARPEVGKTAFAVSIACGVAFQGKRVLYYANEEPIVDIILRVVSNMSGMTTNEIKANPEKAQGLAVSRGFENIIFVYASSNSPWEVKALCKKHKPDFVVIDQLRNMNMKVDGLTELLERAAKVLRDVAASTDCLIMSITQAGDSAQGKAVLSMSDIDSSKTGLQGACDVLILIGKNEELDRTGRRCLTLAKNKVSGNHDSIYVNINEQLSRITG